MFQRSDYFFELPSSLIAENAVHPAHDARLMVIDKSTGAIFSETTFWYLDTLLDKNHVLFFNNSRVVPARISLQHQEIHYHEKLPTILSKGEILFLKTTDTNQFEALIFPGKKFPIGATVKIGKYTLTVVATTQKGRIFSIHGGSVWSWMQEYGALPLPPYITYKKEKERDYQSMFATKDGSVAAPTASLHFSQELIQKLPSQQEVLTLHVGIGTFQTIDTEDIRKYTIHSEQAEIDISLFSRIADIKRSQKSIVAVGTTSCRTLETLPFLWKKLDNNTKKLINAKTCNYWNALTKSISNTDCIKNFSIESSTLFFETAIYITPEYNFYIVDELITNFHLPYSSLLVLVASFLQQDIMPIYWQAILKKYRFFSFGDGMYIKNIIAKNP